MISGIHAPNKGISKQDIDIVVPTAGNFKSVKLLHIAGCQHTIADGRAYLDAGVPHIMLRLPDSHTPGGNVPSEGDYAQQCAAIINGWFYSLGVTDFQLDNEPNWTWVSEGYGPWEYQWFIQGVAQMIRGLVPPQVKIWCAPLSYSPALYRAHKSNPQNPSPYTLDDWRNVYSASNIHTAFNGGMCANVYYQSDRQLDDPSFGASYLDTYALGHSVLSVAVTEWACNAQTKINPDTEKPAFTPHEVETMRINNVPRWLANAKRSGIVPFSYTYISPGATPDWGGYYISTDVAKAMSTAMK